MGRTTTRNFLNVFRRAGITFFGGAPKMSQDIQMVSVMDDHSERQGGIPVSGYYGVSSGAVSGGTDHGILELQCNNQNGIIIQAVRCMFFDAPPQPKRELFVYTLDADNREIFTPTQPPLAALLASKPRGPDSAIATVGRIGDAQLFTRAGFFDMDSSLEFGVPQFFLSQGRFLYAAFGPQATFSVLGYYFIELPDDEPPT